MTHSCIYLHCLPTYSTPGSHSSFGSRSLLKNKADYYVVLMSGVTYCYTCTCISRSDITFYVTWTLKIAWKRNKLAIPNDIIIITIRLIKITFIMICLPTIAPGTVALLWNHSCTLFHKHMTVLLIPHSRLFVMVSFQLTYWYSIVSLPP